MPKRLETVFSTDGLTVGLHHSHHGSANCCKGNKPSQWETPIFGPLYSSKTPQPMLMKFVTSDYVVDATTHTDLRF